MRAHDWLVLITVLAVFAFRDTMPPRILHVFFRFCEVITQLTQRVVILSELDRIQQNVVECLSLVELVIPDPELTILFHLLVHCVHYIRLWGPYSSFWMFPMERYVGCLARGITNRSAPTAMLTRFYRAFTLGEFYRPELEQFWLKSPASEAYKARSAVRGLDTSLEVMAVRYLPHIPVLQGRPTKFTIPESDVPFLQRAFAIVHKRYGELCKRYEADKNKREAAAKEIRRKIVFPPMAAWTPSAGSLSAQDELLIWGPTTLVAKFHRATIGGVRFRSAEVEHKLKSRSSFFQFDSSSDGKSVFREYGRVLYFCAVEFDNEVVPVFPCIGTFQPLPFRVRLRALISTEFPRM